MSIRTRLAWPLCLSLAVAGGCDGGALVPSPSASPSHPGVPPLAADDPGQLQWRGLLACADCEGIDMRLHLERADVPRYELVELFLVGGGEERFLERGRWAREGRLLRLQADDGAERVFAIEADGRTGPDARSHHAIHTTVTGRTEPSGFFQIAFTEVVDTGAFAIPNQQEHAMHHRIRSLALAVALAASGGVAAQDFAFGWNPRSGDVWVDTYLNDINDYGYRYREPFVDELVRYHDAPRDLVTELLIDRRWAPGDVYYACSIASVLGRPCRYVVDEWDRDHGQGWGALAQRLGIKPGSAEFHRLKKGFVPTYDRWARPIELDNDLVRVYPDRRRITIADRDLRIDADGRGNGNGKAKGNNKAGGNDKVKGNGKGNADKGKPAHAGKDKGKPDHAGGGKDKGGGKSGDKGKGKGKS